MASTEEREAPTVENTEYTLPVNVQTIFRLPPDAVFESDHAFLQHIDAIETLKTMEVQVTQGVEDKVFFQNSEDCYAPQAQAVKAGRQMVAVLSCVHEQLVERFEQRIQAHEASGKILPRLERLCRKFELRGNEKRILLNMVVTQVSEDVQRRGGMFRASFRGGVTALALAIQLNMQLTEVVEFFASTRKHIKEGMIPTITHAHLPIGVISENSISILLGMPVKPAQFLSIESPTLAEVVSEEPGFDQTAAGKAAKLGKPAKDADADDEDPELPKLKKNPSYLDGLRSQNEFKEETLYMILKKEETREKAEWQENMRRQSNPRMMESVPMPPGVDMSTFVTVGEPEGKGDWEEVGDVRAADVLGAAQDEIDAREEKEETEEDQDDLKPYLSDLQYLQDQFALVALSMKLSKTKKQIEDSMDMDDDERNPYDPYQTQDMYDPMTGRMLAKEQLAQKRDSNLRKLKSKERVMRRKVEQRLALTKQKGPWMPRFERLAQALTLQGFEKNVVISMIGASIAPSTVSFANIRQGFAAGHGSSKCTVNDLLNCFCSSLEEQIRSRRYFYKSAVLVKEGILNLHGTDFAGDLTECVAEIDRRMLDFVVGLDTEFSEIVDGSHLYSPNVNFEDVVLPEETKTLLLQTVENFDTYKLVQKNLEIDKKITYGRGMALLFYGPSGTGKTMMANALATKLGKKVLLINFPYLGTNEAGQIIKLIFRESKIHDAILFFDECESIFMSRDKGAHRINMILTELERHDGLSILATNRPYDLDEAMYRRITLAVEFRKPDHLLREHIWESLRPDKLPLAKDVSIGELAMKYELTGGFIKNTWLSALSIAVSRDGVHPTIQHEDLRKAAAHQLRGRLSMIDFDRRIVPTRGLDDVILPQTLKQSLSEIVDYGKAQAILFGQWGFQKQHGSSKGIAALFHGVPGTGKTMAAEAIGYDLGKPLKVVNCAQLISKWVGESQKNIDTVFDEAKQVDAVLVFDEAEGLFGSRADLGGGNRHDSLNVSVLLHHIETFSGIVIVITNMRDMIDPAFFRRFKFVMEFHTPDSDLRKHLWRLLVPGETPLAPGVNFDELAARYQLSGGSIKSAVFRAASRAALRTDPAERLIRMEDFRAACEEELSKDGGSSASHLAMYT